MYGVKLFNVKFNYGGHNDNILIVGRNKKSVKSKFLKTYKSDLIELKDIQVVQDVDGYRLELSKIKI